MRFVSLILLFSILVSATPVFTQTVTPAAAPPVQSTAASKPLEFGLPDGTPVKLRTARNLSSADEKTGGSVDFEVLEDVKVGDLIVIPHGSTAIGTVTNAKPKGRMGKAGKLDITIDYVRTVAGDKVALRAVKETKGSSSTGAMTGAIVATSILFFPAAPFFLFMKGKDITIPKGTAITSYVNGDTPLDPKRIASAGSPAADPSNSAAGMSTISVKSDPDNAEISIDGKFVGSTPSALQLTPGDHTISVTKTGYKDWLRTVTSTAGGSVTINAALEKTERP